MLRILLPHIGAGTPVTQTFQIRTNRWSAQNRLCPGGVTILQYILCEGKRNMTEQFSGP
jgi:hypothetical protein